MNTTITYRKSDGQIKTYTVVVQGERVAKTKGNRVIVLALDVAANRVKSFYRDSILSGL